MLKLPIFDPKQVPVFQVDTHLDAVPAHHLTPEALQARFANPRRGSLSWCVSASSRSEHLPKPQCCLESSCVTSPQCS